MLGKLFAWLQTWKGGMPNKLPPQYTVQDGIVYYNGIPVGKTFTEGKGFSQPQMNEVDHD